MSAEFETAKKIFNAFKEVKVEYTSFAGGRTEYSELNYREKKECALICANLLLKNNLDSIESEKYYKKVITIIENDEIN